MGSLWLPLPIGIPAYRLFHLVRRRTHLRSANSRRHMLREQMLRLDALPMLQPAKVGNNGQFADPALFLKISDLPDNLFRSADEPDFLVHNLVIGQPGQ